MSHDRWRDELRASGRDAGAIATLLTRELPADGLQHAGGTILAAPLDPSLDAVTERLIEALEQRGWDGDEELVAGFRSRGGGEATELAALPVELDQLAESLEQSGGDEAFLDLDSGIVWPAVLLDDGQGPDDFDPEDSERWLLMRGLGSSGGYSDMVRFIATVTNTAIAGRLEQAIEGRGAFRRFRDELERHPDEFTRWHRFRDDSQLGRARHWLAEHGYRSVRP